MGTGFTGISTNTKVRIAQILSAGLRGARALVGKGSTVQVRRGGLNWNLDLREGIDLALYMGIYEPHVAKALPGIVREDDVIIDIGANIGAQTLPLANLAGVDGKVIAVEPTQFAFRKLLSNLELNSAIAGRTIPVQAMLGADDTQLEAAIPSSWPLAGDRSGIDADFAGKPQSTKGARILSLDALVAELELQRLDLIKLDVDGYEGDVLSGATQTLARFAPRILMEVAPYLHERRPGGFDTLLKQVSDFGYRFQDLESGMELRPKRESFDVGASASRDVMLLPSIGGLTS